MAVFRKIDENKKLGLNKSQVARKLGINYKTVTRYWDMEVDEFQELLEAAERASKLDPYREAVLGWLKEFPDLHASQVLDWIKERYNDHGQSERNVRRFVAELRREHGIEKKAPRGTTRQFRNCRPVIKLKWTLGCTEQGRRPVDPLSSM